MTQPFHGTMWTATEQWLLRNLLRSASAPSSSPQLCDLFPLPPQFIRKTLSTATEAASQNSYTATLLCFPKVPLSNLGNKFRKHTKFQQNNSCLCIALKSTWKWRKWIQIFKHAYELSRLCQGRRGGDGCSYLDPGGQD